MVLAICLLACSYPKNWVSMRKILSKTCLIKSANVLLQILSGVLTNNGSNARVRHWACLQTR
jgi:hypothetical protein